MSDELIIDQQKKALRKEAKKQRAQAFASVPDAATLLRDRLFEAVDLPAGAVVTAYWPLGDELDPLPLLHALYERGFRPVLPVMLGEGKPLIFRSWAPGDELVEAGFGTREPAQGKEELNPDVLFVPLLAFDRAGYRLGYGGGFYDRTLEKLRKFKKVTAIGIAYAAQEVDTVIRGPYDQPLDWIVTEREAFQIARNTEPE
ncbi:5-formyltetrahydrofolate cyclo-ligase [Kiloniella laminariae]|uniref:5-formyltetrahydrofolate cyclo-ligase n=1 Tax=Kiloniella laminariae TaxID=454162 RepID=A0ABT4LI86_9PROT|nr:5-formyltetrahydrofolate cyclo-ligase [Kiloniella laminariae]MCZ4280819.1 5-formyltetrahydrofolate cyclo-ligase [Kiloniella laminariae]